MSRFVSRILPVIVCSVLTVPGLADMFKPGVKDQISLGKRAAAQVAKEEKILSDSDGRVAEVRRIAAKLVGNISAAEMKKKPFEYQFNVIESKEHNAFALPGGPIYIYSGLLDELKYEDEIAGILAHEIVHVKNEHWASAYAGSRKRELGITAILLIFNAGDTAFKAAAVTDALLFELPYSRKHESDSDKVGYDLALMSGYNPTGMVNVFEVLKKKSGGGRSTEWASGHPALDRRISTIKERLAKEKKAIPPMTARPGK